MHGKFHAQVQAAEALPRKDFLNKDALQHKWNPPRVKLQWQCTTTLGKQGIAEGIENAAKICLPASWFNDLRSVLDDGSETGRVTCRADRAN